MVKPRGRTGPHVAVQPAPAQTSNSDVLLAAMIPFLTTMATNASAMVTPMRKSTAPEPMTPTKVRVTKMIPVPRSPVPNHGDELHQFLLDLVQARKIDILDKEAALNALDLTPDIIPDIPLTRFCDLTGLVEGGALKAQKYCREWYARLEEKRLL